MHEIEIEDYGGKRNGETPVKDQHSWPFSFIYCTETKPSIGNSNEKVKKILHSD